MHETVCHLTTVHRKDDDRIYYKECVWLKRFGYKIYLIAPDKGVLSDIIVDYIPLPLMHDRFSRIVKGYCRSVRKVLNTNCNIVHFHDPELMPLGILFRLLGKKVIYDVHEDLPKQILYKQWIKYSFIRSIFAALVLLTEKFSALFYNGIVAATDDIKRKYPEKKTVLIRNLPIIEISQNVKPPDINKEKFVVIYAGGLGKLRGIAEIIDVIWKCEGNMELWLLGQWEDDEYKILCESKNGWKYTRYLGFRPLEEVYSYIKMADVGIVLLYPVKNYLTSLPVKAFEYMLMAKPVIMSDFTYWKEVFNGCGIFVDPFNQEEILAAINTLSKDPELAMKLGDNGRTSILTELSWEKESKKLTDFYQRLFQK